MTTTVLAADPSVAKIAAARIATRAQNSVSVSGTVIPCNSMAADTVTSTTSVIVSCVGLALGSSVGLAVGDRLGPELGVVVGE